MPQQIPNIKNLLAFDALARRRSLRHAANELCVTQSAVSYRMRNLERNLGIELFEEANYELTQAGREYLEAVRIGLASLRRYPARGDAS